ncbi:protein phosphatase 1 regulatory subunit 36 [Bombina bombina]|uniref:protein phosphatase 1 regulatory subunit 36 n=1 Tax=Bombina bombina TaxID=8345 RepID=UPI00235B0C45|nr:protein phosphatase 1 regulatory subunit 36 [Bombina bombina]
MDQITKPIPGQWYWKEESKSLEFSSNNAYSDSKDRSRKGRGIHFQEYGKKAAERYLQTGAKSPERVGSGKILKSAKQSNKREHANVTLDDVKRVALNLLEDNEHLYMTSFASAVRGQQLDDFLLALLCYMSFYLEKYALEKKPKSLVLAPSALVQREMAELTTRTELALRHFAHTYCILVLGEGMVEQHHMACGKSKASATKTDRRFYECLYSFCVFLAWVVFRRRELHVIQEEVGRLFRSNAFNPDLSLRDALQTPGRNLLVEKEKTKKTATYADSRKGHLKRPAIQSIVTQRSPVLISLIPSSKDKSQYLFEQHQLHPSNSSELVQNWSELTPALDTPRIGILGEPLNHFQPRTLNPIGTENEDESAEKEEINVTFDSRGPSSHQSILRPGTGRRSNVISRATTEAAYSDSD